MNERGEQTYIQITTRKCLRQGGTVITPVLTVYGNRVYIFTTANQTNHEHYTPT
jgi:hypothetical protein